MMLALHPDLPLAPRTWRGLPSYRKAPGPVREAVDRSMRDLTGWLRAALPGDRHVYLESDIVSELRALRDPRQPLDRRHRAATRLIINLAVRRYETEGRITIRRAGVRYTATRLADAEVPSRDLPL